MVKTTFHDFFFAPKLMQRLFKMDSNLSEEKKFFLESPLAN